MIKVALITNIPAPYRVDLFYYMQTHLKDYEIHVIYTNNNEENRSWGMPKEKMLNAHVLHSKVLKLNGMIDKRYVHIPANIGSVLNGIDPQVLVVWEYNPAALQALVWSKIHKKKFIHLTDGTLFSERNIGKVQKICRKIISKGCDAAIASSTKAKEKLISWGMDEKQIFISLLTVDIMPYITYKEEGISTSNSEDESILLFVGRITVGKGIDLLIKALPYVNKGYHVRLIGDGRDEDIDSFKELAKDLNVDTKIEYCGFKQGKELIKEYQRASIFVLPTREDCFGLVLLEAMCSKKPIVVSKYADGAYDIVKNGENGFIVNPYNEKEFADAINEILSDTTFKEKCDYICVQEREKFSFTEVSKGYIDAINYVMKKEFDNAK